jgi:hypothetical protein
MNEKTELVSEKDKEEAQSLAQKLVDCVSTATQLDHEKGEPLNVDDWCRNAEKPALCQSCGGELLCAPWCKGHKSVHQCALELIVDRHELADEHKGPGTIRNHDIAQRVVSLYRMASTLKEAATLKEA